MIVGLRRSDVTIQEVDRETMVYNPGTREFHLLNDVAAFAFRHADGRATALDLVGSASETLGRDVTIVEMEAAFAELDRVELLEHPGESAVATVTRRDAVRRLSAVAVALPFITTMLAPSTAMAKSGHDGPTTSGHGDDDYKDKDDDGDDYDHNWDKEREENAKKAREELEKKVKEERAKHDTDESAQKRKNTGEKYKQEQSKKPHG